MCDSKVGDRELVPVNEAMNEIVDWIDSHGAIADPVPAFVSDPLPALEPDPERASNSAPHDIEELRLCRDKAIDLAKHLLVNALLSGAIEAKFINDGRTLRVPTWAWTDKRCAEGALWCGNLRLDIRLPDEWQPWSCASVELNGVQYRKWFDSTLASTPLSITKAEAATEPMPGLVSERLPRNESWVPLTQALSWIEFGFAFGWSLLDRKPSFGEFGETGDEFLVALRRAAAKLTEAARGETVHLRGKWTDGKIDNAILTVEIPPVRLHDYCRYYWMWDSLTHCENNEETSHKSLGKFFDVTVNREELLVAFPGGPPYRLKKYIATVKGMPLDKLMADRQGENVDDELSKLYEYIRTEGDALWRKNEGWSRNFLSRRLSESEEISKITGKAVSLDLIRKVLAGTYPAAARRGFSTPIRRLRSLE